MQQIYLTEFKQTQLFDAVRFNDKYAIKKLIKQGVDVNAQDSNSETLLHWCDNPQTAKLLIDAGSNVNLKDRWSQTCLHVCSNPQIAKLLIDAGSDVNSQDANSKTPLHSCNNPQIAKLLIEKGAYHLQIDINQVSDVETRDLILNAQNKLLSKLDELIQLPNNYFELSKSEMLLLLNLTRPKSDCNPLHKKDIFALSEQSPDRDLISYLQQEKPKLLEFALEYHADKLFGGCLNPFKLTDSLSSMCLSTLIEHNSDAYKDYAGKFDFTQGGSLKNKHNKATIKIQNFVRNLPLRNTERYGISRCVIL